jgi:WD40 repeat protein
MTAEQRLDRDLPVILGDLAVGPYPDYIDDVLATTAQRRQRLGWTFPERWLSMDLTTQRVHAPGVPWRALGALLLIALLLATAVAVYVGAQRRLPEPFGLATNGRVAFASDGDIFTVDPTTGDTRAIVTGSETDSNPAYSPDGTLVAYTRTVADGQRQIYVVGAEGGAARLVTPEPMRTVSGYQFSPDGKRIAIASYEPGFRSIISIAETDGSGLRTLDVDGMVRAPTFRPADGRQIAFVGSSTSGSEGIYAYDLRDDSILTIVEPVRGFSITGGPSYSPDGSRIAYGWWGSAAGPESRVHVMDADGDGVPRIVEPPTSDTFCCEGYPVWSNDGTRLAYFRLYDFGSVLAISPWDAGETGIEVDVPWTDVASVMWSPDDRLLLVTPADDATQSALQQILIDAATGAQIPVDWTTTSPPAWQRVAP